MRSSGRFARERRECPPLVPGLQDSLSARASGPAKDLPLRVEPVLHGIAAAIEPEQECPLLDPLLDRAVVGADPRPPPIGRLDLD